MNDPEPDRDAQAVPPDLRGDAGNTVGALLAHAAQTWPDDPALFDPVRALTFAQARDEAVALSRGLAALDLTPGEHVALWMGGGVDWVVTDYACALLGVPVVPINTRFRPDEAGYLLANSGSVAVVVDSEIDGVRTRDVLDELLPDLPHLRHVITRGEARPDDVDWATLPLRGRDREPAPETDPDAIAYILYTSGTTSFPKGVCLTHRGVVAVGRAFADRFGWTSADSNFVGPPLFSSYGTVTNVLGALSRGTALALLPRFSPRRSLELMQAEHVTTFVGVDTMLRDMIGLVRAGAAPRPDALRAVCAIPMNASLVRDIREVLGAEVFSGYGLTEGSACSALAALHPDGSTVNVLDPLDGVSFRVVDPVTLQDLPPAEVGELWVRGPGVMRDYYEQPGPTAAVLVPPGPWLRTGDLASTVDDRRVRFEGRLKDIVKTGGNNVSALEVERVLKDHPHVAEAALVGVPDERLTEVGVAFVLSLVESLDAEDVLALCRARLASFKVPRRIVVVDEFPLTATGKVQKSELRVMFLAGDRR